MKQYLKSALVALNLAFMSLIVGTVGADDNVACYVTGGLNGDYLSVSVDGEYKLSGFVKTSPILGVALSFSVPDSGKVHKIEVTIGYDPDMKTRLLWEYDPSLGPYIVFDYQSGRKLSATQSKVAPIFK